MTKLKQFKTLFTAVACLWLAGCAVQPTQTRVQHNAIPVSFVPTAEEEEPADFVEQAADSGENDSIH